MKGKNSLRLFTLLAAGFMFAATVTAQDAKPADVPPREAQRPAMKQFGDRHVDLLHRLGLAEEQIQQIRKLHMDNKPLMDAAQKRFREAKRMLDDAIYADQMNEADVQTRLKDLQLAQAEMDRLRFMTEFGVRRILTQEQLVKFRELRQRFEKMRQELKSRGTFNGDRTFNRQRQNRPQSPEPSARPMPPKEEQNQDL